MQDLLAALALVLIIEGLLPFASPRKWRETVILVAQQPDKSIRTIGLVLMITGVLALAFVRS